jgi:hypothetical protein
MDAATADCCVTRVSEGDDVECAFVKYGGVPDADEGVRWFWMKSGADRILCHPIVGALSFGLSERLVQEIDCNASCIHAAGNMTLSWNTSARNLTSTRDSFAQLRSASPSLVALTNDADSMICTNEYMCCHVQPNSGILCEQKDVMEMARYGW